MAGKRVPIILKENRSNKKSNFPRKTLEQLFAENIVEVTFRRRHTPPWFIKNRSTGHMKFWRRMLCTSNWRYISSPLTKELYKWKKPKSHKGKAYYRKHNMIIVWDLMLKHWRIVSLDKYNIVGYYPVSKLIDKAKFTAFYRQHIKNLPENRRKHFSDLT